MEYATSTECFLLPWKHWEVLRRMSAKWFSTPTPLPPPALPGTPASIPHLVRWADVPGQPHSVDICKTLDAFVAAIDIYRWDDAGNLLIFVHGTARSRATFFSSSHEGHFDKPALWRQLFVPLLFREFEPSDMKHYVRMSVNTMWFTRLMSLSNGCLVAPDMTDSGGSARRLRY